jgi:hypothetical protein
MRTVPVMASHRGWPRALLINNQMAITTPATAVATATI